MIKNIIFDIGGVLVEFSPEKILRKMGLPETEVLEIAKTTSLGPHWKELDRGVMSKEEVFELMLSETKEEYKADARRFLYDEVLSTVKSFDYSEEWLRELKSRGYNIYLLTNYPDWMFDYHWTNTFTFTKSVDGKVVSAVVKQIKPDEEIYTTLLKKYNLIPEESVFIDDKAENIQTAKALKINGIQFTNIKDVKNKLNSLLENQNAIL
ncbi:MAG: HAD family phosphatase [Treponema sp.]|nr:HAD family phosphatase [Treponema sp.]MCI5607488.1 HAD family phosphatase [Spirochaetia bacterium]MDY2839483.1 HAD family phosphatase [Treponema sp.]